MLCLLCPCLLPTLHFLESYLLQAASSKQGNEIGRCLLTVGRTTHRGYVIMSMRTDETNVHQQAALAFAGCFRDIWIAVQKGQ
ncbi:hypothetical protein QR685DRAFT_518111 [Neurospora intermedia]|uniref:Secreted protein n=1 Tax=Neurospora intermedia TaxID=5142 RepID=A0ABR3DMM6_NEUIN